ncbi:uncharacterized protein LOC143580224 [Bidens hawaiensis]|uniref:uncharacterized protein LOC143580224 n=1 Tax=Bidens hawaiensis TaxID=980011 RepID=UPI0040499A30
MIMVREEGDPAPEVVEYRHGLTPPMRDARRRRFRREPDLNPELVRRVEKDLLNIMNGGTAEKYDILSCWLFAYFSTRFLDMFLHAENAGKKPVPAPVAKPSVSEAVPNAGEPEGSDSDDSDDSM